MFRKTALITAALLTVSACSLHEPTFMNQSKIQVESEVYRADFPAAEVNGDVLAGLAKAYERGGDGDVHVVVTYDPRHRDNTAMNAARKAADIARHLRKNGVNTIKTEILPAWQSGDKSDVFFSFTRYEARGPAGCQDMPGLYNDNATLDEDYKLGCGVNEMLARQVSNPKDLLGRDDVMLDGDGRRSVNVVEGYRAGEPAAALEGQSASEE